MKKGLLDLGEFRKIAQLKNAKNKTSTKSYSAPPSNGFFYGDLVRKGPHSLQVLRYVRTTDHTFTVRGNHEEKVVKSIITWKSTGKHALTSQYDHKWINQLQNEDYEYLKSLPYTISIPCLNITCVHGGLVPGVAVTSQIPDVIMTMKEMTYDTDHWFHGPNHIRPCKDDEVGQPWSTIWSGPQHIYFGHDATRLLQETRFATGLDTGCVYGGHLTGCLLRLNDHHHTVTCQNKEIIRLKAFKQHRKIKTTTM